MRPFVVLIFAALVLQSLSRYLLPTWTIADNFYVFGPLLRILIPLLILWWLAVPFSECGLGLPRFDRLSRKVFVAAAVLITAAVPLILLSEDYIAAYPFYTDVLIDPWTRLSVFGQFTASTLIGWEFIHRSFLLFGGIYLLRRAQVPESSTFLLSALFVLCFEVLFHLTKPALEAFGLILASPVLSWIAWRSRSFWPALGLHLWIEVLFISLLVFVAS